MEKMNWCYYFIHLQQKAIFSKNWGGPEKDRFFLGFFLFYFFWFFSKSFGFMGASSYFCLLFSLLLLFLLFLYSCSSSSSSSSSSSKGYRSSSSSSSPLGCRCFCSIVAIPSCRCHATNLSATSTACGHGGAHSISSTTNHPSTPPTIDNPALVRSQGVLATWVPVATQGTARIILTAHVPPDTCAAAGCITTLNAAYGMVATFFVAEEAATLYYGPWNPLPPGRRHTYFVGGAVTRGRWR